MKKTIILSAMFMLILLIGGCGRYSYQPEEAFAEDLIYYASWANGKWQNEEVNICSYLGNYVHESWEVVNSFVGEIYDLSEPLRGEASGGVVPIRDRETQIFFHGDVDLSYLELAGNYYAMFWIDTGEGGWDNTCFVIKDKTEWLVWKRGHGVYQLQRIDKTEEKVHAYDEKRSFEDNIKIRMKEQGIQCNSYFSNVWSGNWTIEEVICTEDMAEAQVHIGETVFYHNSDVDYFDINFIESGQDKIFYHMPTTGELGLEGAYYLLIWGEDNKYPAAVVASEHEMFLIQGNTVFRAVQEEEYFNESLLQGL